jgi:hypothetical protein
VRVLVLACVLSSTAAGIATAAACGGSAFSTVPLDSGGGASEAGGVPEASGGGDAADAGDATAAADASDASDAGSAPDHWCAGRQDLFCEDFDEQTNVTPFLSTWTTSQSNGGTFLFDTSDTVPSPPNALRVTGSSGAQTIVVQTEQLMPHPKSLRLGFELRINQSGSVGLLSAAGFAAVAYGGALSDGYVAMAIGYGPSLSTVWSAPADAGASDAGTFQGAKAGGTFPAAMAWAGRYTLEIDYGAPATASSGCIQAFDGVTPLLTPCMPLPPSLSNPSVVSIAIGDYAGGLASTGDVDIEFDDVTLDVTY